MMKDTKEANFEVKGIRLVVLVIPMQRVKIFGQLWEYLRLQGLKTIEIIDEAKGWDFRVNLNEFTVKETFHHAVKSIIEDTGNWFLKDSTPYEPFQWGEKTQ